nr:EOG090X0EI4 [Polyphemus pediculus]
MIFRRFFHQTSIVPFYASSNLNATSLLASLRKKTGYSISNCKKALEITGNDLAKAESWLDSQAQEQGWLKAAKLQNRATNNGLVGVSFNNSKVAMVEVNCETDFVARNEKFQALVAEAARSCLISVPTGSSTMLQVNYSSEQLGDVPFNNGSDTSKLSDLVALNIGQIGENMSLCRGAALQCPSNLNIKLACSSHPAQSHGEVLLGKYGAVLAYEEVPAENESGEELPEGVTLEKLPKQLCQHIIGMNPKTVERIGENAPKSEEESALLLQEFVINPEYTVGEILSIAGLKVHGFLRFECGEQR